MALQFPSSPVDGDKYQPVGQPQTYTFGTGKWSVKYDTQNALSSSYALSASYAANAGGGGTPASASYATSASVAESSKSSISSSYSDASVSASYSTNSDNSISSSYSANSDNSVSASYSANSDNSVSASYASNSDVAISSSYASNSDNSISASYSVNSDSSVSASYSVNADNAQSASYVPMAAGDGITINYENGAISISGSGGAVVSDLESVIAAGNKSSGSISIGVFNVTSSISSVAFGRQSQARAPYSFAHGYRAGSSNGASAIGTGSHAEGWGKAVGVGSHAEGQNTTSSGSYSHTEGIATWAYGNHSHAEGITTTAGYQSSSYSQYDPTFLGLTYVGSAVDDVTLQDSGEDSTAFFTADLVIYFPNGESDTVVSSTFDGTNTLVTLVGTAAIFSNAVDVSNVFYRVDDPLTIGGTGAHSEGEVTWAKADASHTEGYGTITNGIGSHAEGYYTQTVGDYSHASGQFNIPINELSSFVIGKGADDANRANILEVLPISNITRVSSSLEIPGILDFDYSNDGQAATAGIPIGGIYHTNGTLMIRRS